MKRPLVLAPGLSTQRCPWLKNTMQGASSTEGRRKSKTPCWCILWSTDRDGNGAFDKARLAALVFLVDATVCRLSPSGLVGGVAKLHSEERAQLLLYLDDSLSANRLYDDDMVSWQLSSCFPLSPLVQMLTPQQLAINHRWVSAASLSSEVQERLLGVRLQDHVCTLTGRVKKGPGGEF